MSRVPLPDDGVTASGRHAHCLLRGRYSSVIAPTDSFANPYGSSILRPWPRARSLCRLLPVPAANGIFPTLSLRIFPRMPGPLARRSREVPLPVSSLASSAFPNRGVGRLPAITREYDFSRKRFSQLQTFLYVQASEFARLPDRSYRCAYCHRAAETFTSGHTVLRYLCTYRIC